MNRRLRAYTYLLGFAFWTALVVALVAGPPTLETIKHAAPLVALALLGEELVVRQRQASSEGAISFSAVSHVAAAILLPPPIAAATAAAGILIGDGLRGDGRRYLLINSAMFGSAVWLSAMLFDSLRPMNGWALAAFPALALLVATRYAITSAIFAGGLAIAGRGRYFSILRQIGLEEVASAAGEGSLGVLLALGLAREPAMLPFLAPLLGALYAAKANLERLREETSRALNAVADVIDARDPSTAAHSERVADYVASFADAIELPRRERDRLVQAARFHDLGKIAVEVQTLTKEGRLTEEELAQIRRHAKLSAQLLRPYSFAVEMADFVELHHERHDGRGYYEVKGDAVPIEAHVLIVADSFDAMTSVRSYRPALTKEEAAQEVLDKAGTQFHPLVARAFAAVVSGQVPGAALDEQELRALRRTFTSIRPLRLPSLTELLQPRSLLVAFLILGFALAGLSGQVPAALAAVGAAGVAALVWGLTERSTKRRRLRARAAASTGSAAAIVAAGGFDAWTAWIHDRATPLPEPPSWGTEEELGEVRSWAHRRPGAVEVRLTTGRTLLLSEPQANGDRLAVVLARRPRPYERDLLGEVIRAASACADAVQQPARARRRRADDDTDARRAVLVVELNAFESLRRTGGQLLAERVVDDAELRIRGVLRANDAVIRLDDDVFGVSTLLPDGHDLDRIRRRIAEAVDAVALPRRSGRMHPRIEGAVGAAVAMSARLAHIDALLLPDKVPVRR
jgi:HD-GYP domain-containing protein (c-di-GMP phosphodiesterase class II)/GGDEF domain-containing protein